MTSSATTDHEQLANVGAMLACARRPFPPASVATDIAPPDFVPAPSVAQWILDTFVLETGTLHNLDHEHLASARLGVVWTNVPNRHQERWLVGTAEMPQVQGGAWKRGRATHQFVTWFGFEPDFLLTLYAPVLGTVTDREFCAVIEHELYHCAQATTRDGVPRFHRDGTPIYGIRGHDVEEFIGVVRRYGAIGNVRALAAAVHARAVLTDERVATACGTCLRGMGAN